MAVIINQRIEQSLKRVEKQLRSYLSVDFPYAKKLVNYGLKGKGKRLRARIALLSGSGKKNSSAQVEKLAAAIELFHHATLIHDDVIDHAKIRRKQLSINQQFGNQAAVMLGDYLFTKVMNWMVREMPVAVQKIMAHAITQVCVGEIEEIGLGFNYQLSVKDYMKIIRYKTASLFSAACESGARLGGRSKNEQQALSQYGLKLGMAFQIQDDLLDIIGSDKKTGKQPGIDMLEGRITLPIIIALERSKPLEQKKLKKILEQGNLADKHFQVLMDKTQAIEKTIKIAKAHSHAAKQAIRLLPDTLIKQELILLANFSVDREH